MPRRTYFFDASALFHKYARLKDTDSRRVYRRLTAVLADAAGTKGVSLQVPNICMAECAKAFAKLCFEEEAFGAGDKATAAYQSLRDALLRDVREDRIINSYELRRAHFHDIERIFQCDYDLPAPRKGGKRLSSHDALIISMATEYAERHHDGRAADVQIITCDRRIAEFSAGYAGEFASAACILDVDAS